MAAGALHDRPCPAEQVRKAVGDIPHGRRGHMASPDRPFCGGGTRVKDRRFVSELLHLCQCCAQLLEFSLHSARRVEHFRQQPPGHVVLQVGACPALFSQPAPCSVLLCGADLRPVLTPETKLLLDHPLHPPVVADQRSHPATIPTPGVPLRRRRLRHGDSSSTERPARSRAPLASARLSYSRCSL